ncbi:MAG TPA: Flp family type IVb pilin [Acidimicrobiales bacterium]|nr:Flp family type IVb pilin [Acidimicrobiales bacterium]
MNQINAWWEYCQAFIRTKIRNEHGASLVEYALLLALIAVVCIAAITLIGNGAKKTLSSAGSAVNG